MPPKRSLLAPGSGASPFSATRQHQRDTAEFLHREKLAEEQSARNWWIVQRQAAALYGQVVSEGGTSAYGTWADTVMLTTDVYGTSSTTCYATNAWYSGYQPPREKDPDPDPRHPRKFCGHGHPGVSWRSELYHKLNLSNTETTEDEVLLTVRAWNCDRANTPARLRAEKLLQESLTPEQLQTYRSLGYFDVIVPDVEGGPTPGTYRIQRGQFRNVFRIDPKTEAVLSTHCLHPSNPVPHEDAMFAQSILLRFDPTHFAKNANVWEGYKPCPGGVS